METFTTTIDAENLSKILPLPKKMMKKKFKVIAIPLEDDRQILSEMKKIFSEAKKFKINPKSDINKIADEMNNDLF